MLIKTYICFKAITGLMNMCIHSTLRPTMFGKQQGVSSAIIVVVIAIRPGVMLIKLLIQAFTYDVFNYAALIKIALAFYRDYHLIKVFLWATDRFASFEEAK